MRLLIINTVLGTGSTGRICEGIYSRYNALGWDVRVAYGRFPKNSGMADKCGVKIGSTISVCMHGILTRLFGWHGNKACSYFSTRRFLLWAEKWKPDLLWLHNIHGYYINFELLFRWIKRHPDMEVKWTLHDCWAFTGHCSHFMLAGCKKWETGCGNCPAKGVYPASLLLDSSKSNWIEKRSAFTGVKRLSLIVPSQWLSRLLRKSFLREYPVLISHNTIDTSVFKPINSDFKNRMGIADKQMVLGVASNWDMCKGLSDFIKLRALLNDEYVIVLVGLSRRQIKSLPLGIIGLARTGNAKELAEIYSDADWFVNPTSEDNYPTVNLEAKACGCRVITYDTGGASETIEGYDRGWVLAGQDKSPEGMYKVIMKQESSE